LWALVVGTIGLLILVLVGGAVLAARRGLVSTTPGIATAPTSGTQSGSAAVRAVIQLAKQEQQQAFAQDKPTLMRGTATAAYYAQLVALDTTLRNSGVTAIQLRSTTFGPIVVQSNTAQATTTETWQATFTGGSTATNTTVNNYNLLLVGGQWKITSDTQPRTNVPPSSTGPGSTPTASPAPGSAPKLVGLRRVRGNVHRRARDVDRSDRLRDWLGRRCNLGRDRRHYDE
jgi:hypothetical protein